MWGGGYETLGGRGRRSFHIAGSDGKTSEVRRNGYMLNTVKREEKRKGVEGKDGMRVREGRKKLL